MSSDAACKFNASGAIPLARQPRDDSAILYHSDVVVSSDGTLTGQTNVFLSAERSRNDSTQRHASVRDLVVSRAKRMRSSRVRKSIFAFTEAFRRGAVNGDRTETPSFLRQMRRASKSQRKDNARRRPPAKKTKSSGGAVVFVNTKGACRRRMSCLFNGSPLSKKSETRRRRTSWRR